MLTMHKSKISITHNSYPLKKILNLNNLGVVSVIFLSIQNSNSQENSGCQKPSEKSSSQTSMGNLPNWDFTHGMISKITHNTIWMKSQPIRLEISLKQNKKQGLNKLNKIIFFLNFIFP